MKSLKSYCIKSIQFNKKSYALISIVSIVGLSFIFVIFQLLLMLMQNENATAFEEMRNILIVFGIIIISSVCAMLSTAFKILYQIRKDEIENLMYIGCSKKTIKKIFFCETIFLSMVICLASLIFGTIITFLINYISTTIIQQTVLSMLMFLVLANVMFCVSVNKQFVFFLNSTFGWKQRKQTLYSQKKGIKTLCFWLLILMIYGTIRIIFINFFTSSELNFIAIGEVILTCAILFCIKPFVFFLFKYLSKLAEKRRKANLSLALKHIFYDMPKTLWIIGNMIFSISLLIFFLVMFHAIPQSTIKFIDESTKYSHLYTDKTFAVKDEFEKNKDKVLASSLDIEGYFENKRTFSIKGIDDDYVNAEQIGIVQGNSNLKSKTSVQYITAIISGLDAQNHKWDLDDILTMKVDNRILKLKIVGINNSFIYGTIYVNKESLSNFLYGNEEFSNTWYTKDEISFANSETSSLHHQTRNEIITKAEKAILGGTEIIETILYVYVIISFCMLFNIFIVSLDERKHSNKIMIDIGIRVERVKQIQLSEISIVALTGVIGGFTLGYWSIQNLPDMVKWLYGFEIALFVPLSVPIVFGGLLLLSLLCTKLLTAHITKNCYTSLQKGGNEND